MLADGNNAFKQMLQNFSLSDVVKQPTNFSTSRGTNVENIESVNVLTLAQRLIWCWLGYGGI